MKKLSIFDSKGLTRSIFENKGLSSTFPENPVTEYHFCEERANKLACIIPGASLG
jgi:hypothetical protein